MKDLHEVKMLDLTGRFSHAEFFTDAKRPLYAIIR